MQGLAKSIAWDGEGATCLIEVCVLEFFIPSLYGPTEGSFLLSEP